MDRIALVLLGIIAFVVAIPLGAYAYAYTWNTMIVALFAAPIITPLQAYCAAFVIGLPMPIVNKASYAEAIATVYIKIALAPSVAWIVTHFFI